MTKSFSLNLCAAVAAALIIGAPASGATRTGQTAEVAPPSTCGLWRPGTTVRSGSSLNPRSEDSQARWAPHYVVCKFVKSGDARAFMFSAGAHGSHAPWDPDVRLDEDAED